jgi:hypothetical protein
MTTTTREQIEYAVKSRACTQVNFDKYSQQDYPLMIDDIMAIIDAACTEAELYGRLHETIEHFQWGALTVEQYSNRHDELTERISKLQSRKDEVTHE